MVIDGLTLYGWRLVFLVSVPVGVIGSIWSLLKLKDNSIRDKSQKIDYAGNVIFGVGITVFLIALTYGLLPYGSSVMGWSDPYVIAGLIIGTILIIAFPFVELRVKQPMFKMSLFKVRSFSFGNFASLLGSLGRGGVMFMLIILLQGVWLPLHGVPYSLTPFYAGIYMIPLTLGFLTMGPIGGALSDKFGARGIATIGMVIVAVAFILLSFLPYNFYYPEFAVIIYLFGFGSGMFAAPNTAAIMNSVSAKNRGIASGMVATVRNVAQTASMGIFFTIVIVALSTNLPVYFNSALASIDASIIAPVLDKIPPTAAIYSAFLEYNPMGTILASLPTALTSKLSASAITTMEGKIWFPTALAPAVMSALRDSFYIGATLSAIAAILSLFRGKRYFHEGSEMQREIDDIQTVKNRKMVRETEPERSQYTK